MDRKSILASLVVAGLAAVASVGVLVGGCGSGGDFTCPNPSLNHIDPFDNSEDPCCNTSICCANPQVDHWVKEPDTHPDHLIWDPCCKTEECPGVNVNFKPPDQGKPSGIDAGTDASADASSAMCDGPLAPPVPPGFWGPALLWTGAPGEEPSCPAQARHEAYRGYAGLQPSAFSCPTCACDAPTGTCSLPSKMWASSTNCAIGGGISTPFDPPANWDGGCTASQSIPQGASCNGAPCAKSLWSAPLTLTESSCTPRAITSNVHARNREPDGKWTTSAVACQLDCGGASSDGACTGGATPGYAVCVFQAGNLDQCPATYPEKRVFFRGQEDTRTCSECSCGAPKGSQCEAFVSAFQSASCGGAPAAGVGIGIGDVAFCGDIGAGSGLSSKAASKPVYVPGSCSPQGGAPTGAALAVDPTTFCCA